MIAASPVQSPLMFQVNQQLVARAIEEWDEAGEGSYPCFLIKFVHCCWREKARWN